MARRGFIGPLGDDIPGMFPIIAGIFIFLLSIFYISGQVDSRNSYLDLKQGTLELSYLATEKGFMPATEFDNKCKVLKEVSSKNHLSFAVVLKKYCGQVDLEQAVVLQDHGPDWGTDLVCSSNETIDNYDVSGSTHWDKAVDYPYDKAFSMTYPMAVECKGNTKGIGMITVAGWR